MNEQRVDEAVRQVVESLEQYGPLPTNRVVAAGIIRSAFLAFADGGSDPAVRTAAEIMYWRQVVMNGGPPCFWIDEADGRFCGRAQRWEGHDDHHKFVPLHELFPAARQGPDILTVVEWIEAAHPREKYGPPVARNCPTCGEEIGHAPGPLCNGCEFQQQLPESPWAGGWDGENSAVG